MWQRPEAGLAQSTLSPWEVIGGHEAQGLFSALYGIKVLNLWIITL